MPDKQPQNAAPSKPAKAKSGPKGEPADKDHPRAAPTGPAASGAGARAR